jgi:hypothetical protein
MYFRSEELVITSTRSIVRMKGKVSKTVSEVFFSNRRTFNTVEVSAITVTS